MLVGEYASYTAGDFSIEVTPFNCTGCESSHQLALSAPEVPSIGKANTRVQHLFMAAVPKEPWCVTFVINHR
jgi:hypothetical protein